MFRSFDFAMDMKKKKKLDDEDLSLFLHKNKQGCLIQKILVWLPVVSLLRFKAVCKSWRDLIQSPLFIDDHLHTLNSSSSSSKFGSFIVHVLSRWVRPPRNSSSNSSNLEDVLLMSSQSDSESESGGGSGDDQEGPVVVVHDLGFDMEEKEILGSCNGLVCLSDINFEESESEPDQVYLWNPATRQIMILPETKTNPLAATTYPFATPYNNLVVFGLDLETKDYKVVQFTGLKRRRSNGNGRGFCFCEVQVYSLSTDSWRRLEGIPCLPGHPFNLTDNDSVSVLYLNGTCFFLAYFFYTRRHPCLAKNNRFIISFDFTKEIITPIQLPDHHRDQELYLYSWGGDKIALFTSPKPLPFQNDARIGSWQDFNIWVLNYERGSSSSVNKKSWTKLHSFQIQLKSRYEWYVPRGISNDGKFALLTAEHGKKMNLYNFATKEVKKEDFLPCIKVMSKAHAYKPSLVSVKGGNGAGGNGAGSSSSSSPIG